MGHVGVRLGGLCRGGVQNTRVEWAVKIFTE